MKKNYIQPAIEVMALEANLICMSTFGTTDLTSGNLGKRRGRLEEDYEEEDLIDIWK